VYKALNGLQPQCLADNCQLITTTGCWRLQSSDVATCDVPRTRTSLHGRSILHCCWSTSVEQSTTSSPRLELSLLEFWWSLKTRLFGWRSQRLVTYFRYSALYKCTFLLTYWFFLLDGFSRFCTAHPCANTQTDTQTTLRATCVATGRILCTACRRCGPKRTAVYNIVFNYIFTLSVVPFDINTFSWHLWTRLNT